ncbi:MAG: MerR family transcriptional regulator [Bacillota bacterium]
MSGKKTIPMRIVREKTGLTARQIRYYDEVDLVHPERSPGNQRLFSEADIDLLRQISSLIDEGYTVSTIRKMKENGELTVDSREQSGVNQGIGEELTTDYGRGKLTSLYPVSDRSQLVKLLNRKDKGED